MKYDIDTELRCINSALLTKSNLIKIMVLNKDDFYDEKCKIIFSVMKELYNKGISVDMPNISLKLKELDCKLVNDSFFSVIACQESARDIEQLVNKIKDFSDKRKIDHLSLKIKESNSTDSKELVISNIHTWLRDIEETNISSNNFIGDLVNCDISDFELKETDYVKSHLGSLNKQCFGHVFGDLTIIAARPGQGKSTFALEEALEIAKKESVDFFTLEMPCKQLALKALSCLSGVDSKKIRAGNLCETEVNSLMKSVVNLKDRKLNIIDNCRTLDSILNRIRQNNIKYGTKVAIIDYLQLTKTDNKQDRRLQVAEVSRELKACAVDLNMCIIALSQLNRLAHDKIPSLADLAESGSIEQDADNVYFIYTEKKEDEVDNTMFIIAKCRMGGVGIINVYFDKKRSSFKDLHYGQEWGK